MAEFKSIDTQPISVQAGFEEWDGGSWIAASRVPTVGDEVYANGFNKEIDQSWTVDAIHNTVFQGTTASGRFEILSAGITFSGDRYPTTVTVPILYISYGGGTSTVLGEQYSIDSSLLSPTLGGTIISGLAGGILNLESAGITNTTGASSYRGHSTVLVGNGNGFILNLVNCYGWNGTTMSEAINRYCDGLLLSGSNYVVNLTGVAEPSSLVGANGSNYGGGVAIRDIGVGNQFNNYGTINASPTTGLYNNGYQGRGASCIFRNYGQIVGTQFSNAVVQLHPSSEVVLVEGNVINGLNYIAIVSYRLTVTDADDFQWQLKTTSNADRSLYTAGLLTGYPLESKVEDGTVYGPSSEFTGTMLPWSPAFAQALANAQRDLQLPQILSAITQP